MAVTQAVARYGGDHARDAIGNPRLAAHLQPVSLRQPRRRAGQHDGEAAVGRLAELLHAHLAVGKIAPYLPVVAQDLARLAVERIQPLAGGALGDEAHHAHGLYLVVVQINEGARVAHAPARVVHALQPVQC